jgi:transcriptional regulator with XRE-family HTH domain
MKPTAAVGKRIRRLRQDFELSQTEFAKKIGVDQNSVSVWERGKRAISLANLLKIHLTFHVSLSFFDIAGRKKECNLWRRTKKLKIK